MVRRIRDYLLKRSSSDDDEDCDDNEEQDNEIQNYLFSTNDEHEILLIDNDHSDGDEIPYNFDDEELMEILSKSFSIN